MMGRWVLCLNLKMSEGGEKVNKYEDLRYIWGLSLAAKI